MQGDEEQSSNIQVPRAKRQGLSTCAHSRRVTAIPVVVEPAVAPAPPIAAPAETTNAEIAVAVAVNGSPEKDPFAFPFLGNEVLVFWNQ